MCESTQLLPAKVSLFCFGFFSTSRIHAWLWELSLSSVTARPCWESRILKLFITSGPQYEHKHQRQNTILLIYSSIARKKTQRGGVTVPKHKPLYPEDARKCNHWLSKRWRLPSINGSKSVRAARRGKWTKRHQSRNIQRLISGTPEMCHDGWKNQKKRLRRLSLCSSNQKHFPKTS